MPSMPSAGESPATGEEPHAASAAPATDSRVAVPRDANTPEALWDDFRAAARALTILGRPTDAKPAIGNSAAFYPAVGLSIGFAVAVLDWVLRSFLSQEITSVILVAALALLSAGRQLEGFANVADGLIGFRGREWAMATMRDRRLGTSGAAAIFFLLILKVRSLDLISEPIRFAGVLLPPMIGRWAVVALAHGARTAHATGEGERFDPSITLRELGIACVFGALVTLAFAAALGLLVLLVAVLVAAGLRIYLDRRLGGVSDQSLAAVAEILESVTLLVFALAS